MRQTLLKIQKLHFLFFIGSLFVLQWSLFNFCKFIGGLDITRSQVFVIIMIKGGAKTKQVMASSARSCIY